MKKSFKLLITVFVLVLIVTGCGKGNNKLSDYAGTYQGEYTKLVGDDTKEESEFSLELKADGTGISKRNDAEYKLTWSLDGENFSMKETFLGMSIEYNGTLKDGKLDIFNGDKENLFTYEYVYTKK